MVVIQIGNALKCLACLLHRFGQLKALYRCPSALASHQVLLVTYLNNPPASTRPHPRSCDPSA